MKDLEKISSKNIISYFNTFCQKLIRQNNKGGFPMEEKKKNKKTIIIIIIAVLAFCIINSGKNDNNKVNSETAINSENTTEITTETVTTENNSENPLYKYSVVNVRTGDGNTVLGKRGYILITQNEFNSIPGNYLYDYLTEQTKKNMYFNIFFSDTNNEGIAASGSGSAYTYGKFDGDGSLSKPENDYGTFVYNFDKKVYE